MLRVHQIIKRQIIQQMSPERFLCSTVSKKVTLLFLVYFVKGKIIQYVFVRNFHCSFCFQYLSHYVCVTESVYIICFSSFFEVRIVKLIKRNFSYIPLNVITNNIFRCNQRSTAQGPVMSVYLCISRSDSKKSNASIFAK